MKSILFCINPYAFGILKPLHNELLSRGHDVLWYIPDRILASCSFSNEVIKTNSMKDLCNFGSDAIFVPGNEIPYYLQGVKVQVFHGLAGEKKGHFRIRHYFDLYLTQGPYFTNRFKMLASKYRDFEVVETGWCKLDALFLRHQDYQAERDRLLLQHGKKHLVLFAPTFSPSLTCAIKHRDDIFKLADTEDVLILIKFHDLMDASVVESYREWAQQRSNVVIGEDKNILKYLIMSDLMISDTSSVVYEFLLLNKPVITIQSKSENIDWCDIGDDQDRVATFRDEIVNDHFRESRRKVIDQYHPYNDGKSSARMVDAVEEYIRRKGVPDQRRLGLFRRIKIRNMFGKNPCV